MISLVHKIAKIIIYAIMISIAVSCVKNEKKREADTGTIEAEYVNSDHAINENENVTTGNYLPAFSAMNAGGLIKDNDIRIRKNPGTDAEILGILNADDYVTILSVTKEKQIIDNYLDYWYEIKTNENITGWIFGKYIYHLKSGEPLEFANNKWQRYYGELLPKENITLADIQSCSWHTGYTYLTFSKEGNYAIGERWTGPQYGVYELLDNIVSFDPPFTYFIASVKYQIDKLFYSNEMYLSGTPVLKNIDENLEFYPHDRIIPKKGDMVRINRYYCEKMGEKAKLNSNNILYVLPDKSSVNIFDNGTYYGNKSMEASIYKLAMTTIDGIVWYYINLDFTTEPIDGGGPFFEGWLPEEYLE